MILVDADVNVFVCTWSFRLEAGLCECQICWSIFFFAALALNQNTTDLVEWGLVKPRARINYKGCERFGVCLRD